MVPKSVTNASSYPLSDFSEAAAVVSAVFSAAVVVSAGAAVVALLPGLEEPHPLKAAVIMTAIANANALFFIILFFLLFLINFRDTTNVPHFLSRNNLIWCYFTEKIKKQSIILWNIFLSLVYWTIIPGFYLLFKKKMINC